MDVLRFAPTRDGKLFQAVAGVLKMQLLLAQSWDINVRMTNFCHNE